MSKNILNLNDHKIEVIIITPSSPSTSSTFDLFSNLGLLQYLKMSGERLITWGNFGSKLSLLYAGV